MGSHPSDVVRFVLIGVLAVASLVLAQNTARIRTWTDTTGKFQTDAELLVVKVGKVYLKRSDGQVVGVPLEQLSRADRDYLASLAAPPERLSVTVRYAWNESESFVAPGVIAKAGQHGFQILVPQQFLRVPTHPQAKVRFWLQTGGPQNGEEAESDATEQGGAKGDGVALTRMGTLPDVKLVVLRADKPGPAGLSDAALPPISMGDRLVIHGLRRDSPPRAIPVYAKATVKAYVSELERGSSAEVERLVVRGDPLRTLQVGVVVDRAGNELGFVFPQPGSSDALLLPRNRVASLLAPRIVDTRFVPQRWDETGITYQVLPGLSDPMQRVKKSVLLIKPWSGGMPAVAAEGEGRFARLSAEMASVAIPGPDEATPAPLRYQAAIDAPARYAVQLEATLDDGGRWRSRPLLVEPDFLAHASLRKWRMQLSCLGGKVTPHPSGGVAIAPTETIEFAASRDGANKAGAGAAAALAPNSAESSSLPPADFSLLPAVKSPATEFERPPPNPVSCDEPLALASYTSGTTIVRPLAGAKRSGKPSSIFGLWSEGGDILYLLGSDGVLRKVQVPEFRATAKLELPGGTVGIEQSRAGLIVRSVVEGNNLLWVVDLQTLRVKRRILAGRGELVTSPALSTIYLFGDNLDAIDTATGRVDRYRPATGYHFSNDAQSSGAVISPDGKYLLAVSDGHLLRFGLQTGKLVFEEGSERVLPRPGSLGITPDSQRLVCLCSTKRVSAARHPQFDQGVYVYGLQDLSAPQSAYKVAERPSPHVSLAVPSANGVMHVVTTEPSPSLTTGYAIDGKELYRGEGLYNALHIRLYPHPDGQAMLVNTPSSLLWLVFPGAAPRLKQAPERLADAETAKSDRTVPATATGPGGNLGDRLKTSQPIVTALNDWVAAAPAPVVSERPLTRWPAEPKDAAAFDLGETEPVSSAPVFSDHGKYVFSWDRAGTLRQVDVENQREVRRLSLPQYANQGAKTMARSKEGLVLLFSRYDNRIDEKLDGVPNLLVVDKQTLTVKRGYLAKMVTKLFADPASSLAVLVGEHWIKIVDLKSGELLKQCTILEITRLMREAIPTAYVNLRDFSKLSASAGGGKLRLWLADGRALAAIEVSADGGLALRGWEFPGPLTSRDVAVSPDEKLVVLWDGQQAKLIALDDPARSINLNQGTNRVAFAPRANVICTTAASKPNFQFLDLQGKPLRTIRLQVGTFFRGLELSPQGDCIAAVAFRGRSANLLVVPAK